MTLSNQVLQEDLEDLYEHAPCGYLSLNPEGRIVKVNATFCAWTGRSPEDLKGKRLRDLLNVAGSIFYETHFAPLLRMQGFFHEVALDLRTADGKVLPVLANAVERRAEDGQLLFTRLTVFQAAERRRYERELVEAKEAEREARRRLQALVDTLEGKVAEQAAETIKERETSELREQFIAVLGHDLRNPLAAIDAGANKLLRDGTWTERTPTILRLMRNSVTRMSGLIDNVLDLARSRLGGGIVIEPEPARPLAPTLQQVIEEISAAHPERDIDVRFELPSTPAVDHNRIAQMFSNLLGNAVTHGAEDRPIRVICKMEDNLLHLSVSNGGEPIPSEMVEHLFKPFHRGTVRNNAEGLGLGLYIAAEIAQAHGGRIEVQTNVDETTFTFQMPMN